MTVFPRYLRFLSPRIVKTANSEGRLTGFSILIVNTTKIVTIGYLFFFLNNFTINYPRKIEMAIFTGGND